MAGKALPLHTDWGSDSPRSLGIRGGTRRAHASSSQRQAPASSRTRGDDGQPLFPFGVPRPGHRALELKLDQGQANEKNHIFEQDLKIKTDD